MNRPSVLLVEIGTEDLPSKILRRLGETFSENVAHEFKKMNIKYERIIWYASFRRLATKIINILVYEKVSDSNKNLHYDQFEKNLDCLRDGYFLNKEDIVSILGSIINNALIKLPISKMMKWSDKKIKFIRPVRTVSILLDNEVIPCICFGITANRVIRGHRFMARGDIFLDHAKNYESILLKDGYVIADYEYRKYIIRSGINDITKKIDGVVNYTDNFLEEITALSEWPVVLLGSFDRKFLYIPHEILLYIMQFKKKYFPVYDFHGKLLPYFIFVIDVIVNDSRKIIMDHERVLSQYFLDAEFFLNYDKKCRLEDYLSRLHTVLFHGKLGSLYDKTIRIKSLSSWIAKEIGVDIHQAERAAMLSKCDLVSYMVSEFPFAQGIMGMYYARRDGELEQVALAQKEQYQPRFFSDTLPSTLISCILSLSDKIDTISGIFIIGERPKGSGDPFGLRRAAIGILRIFLEKKIKINLLNLVEYSLNLYKNLLVKDFLREIIGFMYKRVCILYENKGYKMHVIQATLNEDLSDLIDFDRRISSVASFLESKESVLLVSMIKRIFNILKKIPNSLSNQWLKDFNYYSLSDHQHQEEIVLSNRLNALSSEFKLMYDMGHYYDALVLLSSLYGDVNNFFKNLIIMSEDKDIRLNRLMLLYKILHLLFCIIKKPQHIFMIKKSNFND